MKWERFKNYGLWLSILSFIPLLLQSLGLDVLPGNYSELVTTFLGILVIAGIINNPITDSKWYGDDKSVIDKPTIEDHKSVIDEPTVEKEEEQKQ